MTGRWRVALRLARRDARRHCRASILVAALVALPVSAVAAAGVVYRSYQLTPAQAYTRANGPASVELSWAGGALVVQSAPGTAWATMGSPSRPAPSNPAVSRALGPGAVVAERETGEEQVATRAGVSDVAVTTLDLGTPATSHLLDVMAGRVPLAKGAIAVDRHLATEAGVGVGSELRLVYPSRTFTVSAVVADPATRRQDAAWAAPGAFGPAWPSTGDWLAETPQPVRWPEVRRLDRAGFVVQSREVAAHPPSASDVAYHPPPPPPRSRRELALAGLVAGLVLFEVVLVAGPGFAVLGRRQERSLALAATAGARDGDLATVVVATGLVLGGAAGIAGAVGGSLAGWALLPLTLRVRTATYAGVRWDPLATAAAFALAVLVALAASAAPAWSARRTDVATALAGRRRRRPVRRATAPLAAVLAATGVAVALVGGRHRATDVVLAGVALLEVGLVVAIPPVLAVLARAAGPLPLGPRLAVRDNGRNRSAAAPAASAVMAGVLGAVAALAGVATQTAWSQAKQSPTAVIGSVTVTPDPGTADAVATAMARTLPARVVATVSALDPGTPAGGSAPSSCPPPCSTEVEVTPVAPPGGASTRVEASAAAGAAPLVGGPATLEALTGVRDPAAMAALARGEAVVPDGWAVRGGRATVRVTLVPDGAYAGGTTREVSVPAVAQTTGFAPTYLVLPPALVPLFGSGIHPVEVVAWDRTVPSGTQLQALRGTLGQIAATEVGTPESGGGMRTEVARPYEDPDRSATVLLVLTASVVAAAAAAVAAGLVDAERRQDQTVLFAVGCRTGTRRSLAATRAAAIAATGSVAGAAAGLVPVAALVASGPVPSAHPASGVPGVLLAASAPTLHLVVPWAPVLAVVVGVPALAAVCVGLAAQTG